ncbi:MAG: PLP-dependent aminotransferase family protein [Pseudomonadota bacterium]
MSTIWQPTLSNYDGPKYKALAGALKDGVRQGALPPGAKLPTVRELAWQLSITPGTVARAYSILTEAGIFEATVGRGTFVANTTAAPPSQPIEIDSTPHGSEGVTGDISFFSPALPNKGQARLIRELLGRVAEAPPSGLMHYPSQEASRPARQAVLDWLKGSPLGSLSEDDVVLSHGAQNGISLIMQSVLSGARPVVLIEELAYPGFRRCAELLRADVVPVPMDEKGIIPEALKDIARHHQAQILCTSSEVHNPTCLLIPEERRRAIAAVAQEADLQIIEDDCYRMGTAVAPSYRMIAPERSWYVSSISKTLTPALRVGFAIAPHGRGAGLRRAAEHGFFGLASPLTDLTWLLLSDPRTDEIAHDVRSEIERYVETMVNYLGGFALTWRRDAPIAWLKMPLGWRAASFCQAAAELGIKIRPADDFVCRDGRAPHAVRIAINAQLPFDRFERAMATMRDLLDTPPDRIGV